VSGENVEDSWRKTSFFRKGGDFSRLFPRKQTIDPYKEGTFTVRGAFSLLFSTTVFPTVKAGATLLANIMSGMFQGMIAPTTPYGCLNVMLKKPGVFREVLPCISYPASE
jgi:hypothetical protein